MRQRATLGIPGERSGGGEETASHPEPRGAEGDQVASGPGDGLEEGGETVGAGANGGMGVGEVEGGRLGRETEGDQRAENDRVLGKTAVEAPRQRGRDVDPDEEEKEAQENGGYDLRVSHLP
jgi:hypothetical protein